MTDAAAVRLALPAEARYARVARGVAVACATLVDFDVDDLVDVRLMADEVFLAVVALGRNAVDLELRTDQRALELAVRAPHGGTSTWEDPEFELPRLVFEVICVHASYGVDDDHVWFDGRVAAMRR